MAGKSFKALLLEQDGETVANAIKDLSVDDLPEGDVLVDVEYSTLNYKDGMVVNGLGRLVRDYPHVPGIDFAGTVAESADPRYAPGDKVVLTGWHVGERHWGGYSQKARVKADWLVPLPDGLTARRAMAVGTAGFTAMLCVLALEDHGLSAKGGPVLVTGASGGVGSVAVALLSAMGCEVAASTGKSDQADYLKSLGAREIVDRAELSEPTNRPLETERWSAAVDTVGGATLARVLGQMRYGASVAACGLAGGPKLETTVIPFLLRGVNLLGIDSVVQPYESRVRAWDRLVETLPMEKLDAMIETCALGNVPDAASKILKGGVRGRVVVDVNG